MYAAAIGTTTAAQFTKHVACTVQSLLLHALLSLYRPQPSVLSTVTSERETPATVTSRCLRAAVAATAMTALLLQPTWTRYMGAADVSPMTTVHGHTATALCTLLK
jgi:hypothetical protein